MSQGFIYILFNVSLDGMLKIGRTARDPQARARELSRATGVPTPFRVAFEQFVDHPVRVEAAVHDRLDAFRVSKDREFFRYPLSAAIKLVMEIVAAAAETPGAVDSYSAIDITQALRTKYSEWLDPHHVTIRIFQTSDRVYLETTAEEEIAGYLKDQTIKRTDLAFIGCPDAGQTFDPRRAVSENARTFVDVMDPVSIIHCTDLFTPAACKEIDERHRREREWA